MRETAHIAVVGGGIAGIAVAIAFKNRGIPVCVYEKDTHFSARKQGYGLTIQQGQRSIKELGLTEALLACDTPSFSHLIFNEKGEIVGFFGPCFYEPPSVVDIEALGCIHDPAKKKRYNVHVPRQKLRELLLEKYESLGGVVKWGCGLIDMASTAEGWSCTFTGGVRVLAPMVVGADGIFSKVRDCITPPLLNCPLNYLGVLVVLGIVACNHGLGRKRVWQTVDGSTRLFVMPFTEKGIAGEENDTIMWQLSFPCELSRAKALSKDLVSLQSHAVALCKNWHNPIPTMLQQTKVEFISGTPVYDRDPIDLEMELEKLENFEAYPVVLLGDAAHPMSPFKGQGANQALLDAVQCAESYVATDKRMTGFTKNMLARTTPKVLGSREMVKKLHSDKVATGELFESRGIDADLVTRLADRGIGANSARIEDEIRAMMYE